MTVLIADALPVISAGIRTDLARQPDLTVVGAVRDTPSAIMLAQQTRCQLAVVDSELPPLGGIDFLQRLAAAYGATSAPKVVMMAGDDLPDDGAAVDAGASAVVRKSDILGCLAPLLRLLAGNDVVVLSGRHLPGRRWPAAGAGAGPVAPPAAAKPFATLTDREREVFFLAVRGLGCRQIADTLGVKESTARSHLHRVLHKLGVRDRAQLVALAYESGLVRAPCRCGGDRLDP